MLALSTSHAPADTPLPAAVEAMREFGVRAVALHRDVEGDEARGLAAYARMLRFVALFGTRPLRGADGLVLVVEGGPAADDRERTLDELCRRLHPLGRLGLPVALRTPLVAGAHPSPADLPLIAGSLPFLGYWHDADRGGADYLEAAGRRIRGASFQPLGDVDLAGLRDALGAGMPAVVACVPGTGPAELREAWSLARGVFRA